MEFALDTLGSPDRFGYEWAHYRTILPESKGQLERWLGTTGLDSFKDKRVLDVGCGMGRNPYWMIRAGAKEVLAVDIDKKSLEAAWENLSPFPQARVKECSIYLLSKEDLGQFDRVTCIGVLMFLADPTLALKKMWDCVRPGGDLVLWVYAKEGNRLLLPILNALRFIGSRLPLPVSHLLAQVLCVFAYPIIQLLPWQTSYYARLKKLSIRNIESIIFDQIIPRSASYFEKEELVKLVSPLGGELFLEFVQGNSWHIRLTKPLGF